MVVRRLQEQFAAMISRNISCLRGSCLCHTSINAADVSLSRLLSRQVKHGASSTTEINMMDFLIVLNLQRENSSRRDVQAGGSARRRLVPAVGCQSITLMLSFKQVIRAFRQLFSVQSTVRYLWMLEPFARGQLLIRKISSGR